MFIREYSDSDGKCFADQANICKVLCEREATCGTYECPFYKPRDCEDWVKLEGKEQVTLLSPEEYYNARKQ